MAIKPPTQPSFLVASGNFFFKYRDQIFPIVLLPLLILFPPTLLNGSRQLDLGLDILGLLVGIVGECVRVATVGLEYIRRGGLNKQVYADKLVTGGIFSHSRNPLYIGNLLMILSLLMISNNPIVYAIGIPFFAYVYSSIVAAEEAFLQAEFGEPYTLYCGKVRRWLPHLSGIQHTFSEMQFNWNRVFVKEYSSVYPWSVAVLGLLGYQAFLYKANLVQIVPFLSLLASFFILFTAAFIFIRFLKKSGRLTEKSFHW